MIPDGLLPVVVPNNVVTVLVVLGGYGLLLATSGWVVKRSLAWADDAYPGSVTETDRDIGTIVGKTENVLLLTFVLAGAYAALAIVFAAKSIVRSDDMKNNSLFYLAGTLVNVTYSVVVGIALRLLLGGGIAQPVF
ncbi:hypothetical protein [Halovivax gelatinilyticus]|uniref:hypothetical protein n=1 Tax=Halovivax gelatinilyticus TaxID=2961597 RepID=UPI0020CA7875|nr:hypothetical protein [Halovivax gelatinilyticus]